MDGFIDLSNLRGKNNGAYPVPVIGITVQRKQGLVQIRVIRCKQGSGSFLSKLGAFVCDHWSIEEPEQLKETIDVLIEQMERLKCRQ